MIDNIFSPSFGNKPNQLIGREGTISELLDGINTRYGSKERASLILGNRGVGKTVLLLELFELAKKNNYIVASPTIVSGGMLERIVEKIQDEGERYTDLNKSKITGGNVGFLGFSAGLQFTTEERRGKSFPYKLDKLTKALNEKGLGVLILIDEVKANSKDLKELIIAYQEMVGKGRNISLVMAGLPGAISTTINNHVLTFLNRAKKYNLDPLRNGDIDAYYEKSFKELGVNISEKKRVELVERTQGFPYLMQLLGHYVVVNADDNGKINDASFAKAIKTAEREFKDDICLATLNDLSDRDVDLLKVVAFKGDVVSVKEIIDEMKARPDYVNQYKRRLIDVGVLEQVKRGEVRIAIPYIKEYLQENS